MVALLIVQFFDPTIHIYCAEYSQLIPNLVYHIVYTVFLCDHTIGCEATLLQQMDMGSLTCVTNLDAQEWARRDRKTVPPAPLPGD